MNTIDSFSTISSSLAAQAKSATSKTSTSDTLQTAFLQMMISQMRNQNPTDPMKDNEMITQLTQINSLQSLQQIQLSIQALERSNQFLSASNLIGKTVSYKDSNNQTAKDIVTSVTLVGNEVMLNIGKKSISLSDVIGVSQEKTNA
jgi:flagellar basal-body rod modification protein FlgD